MQVKGNPKAGHRVGHRVEIIWQLQATLQALTFARSLWENLRVTMTRPDGFSMCAWQEFGGFAASLVVRLVNC